MEAVKQNNVRRISRFFYIGKIGYKEECDPDFFSLENYASMIRCECGGFLRWHFNAFVAKFCSSSSLKCTLITLSPLPPLSPFQRKRTKLLSIGPNLHISGWGLMLAGIRFVLQYLFDFTCVGYSWGLTFSDIWKGQIKIKIYFLLTQKDVNAIEIETEIVNADILFAPTCVKMTKVVKSVVRVQLLVNQVSIFTCPVDRSGGQYWRKGSCSKWTSLQPRDTSFF